MEEKYYNAYDKRYRQVHEKNISWSSNNNTKIISKLIDKYDIKKDDSILEIGCGEGRDSKFLLDNGYNLLATDVSVEAINYCKKKDYPHVDNYKVLDVLNCGNFTNKFKFIYSVACLHMLVLQADRNKYFKFIYEHLEDNAVAVILSMGDGVEESSSDISKAWVNSKRTHQETGEEMDIVTTSCKIVSFDTLFKEAKNNDLNIIEYGLTEVIPDFPQIMYIVVKR